MSVEILTYFGAPAQGLTRHKETRIKTGPACPESYFFFFCHPVSAIACPRDVKEIPC